MEDLIEKSVRGFWKDTIRELESGLLMADWSGDKPSASTLSYETAPSRLTNFNADGFKEALARLDTIKESSPVYRLIPSIHACRYKTKTVAIGIADKNKPNQKKMLYRKKRITTMIPMMYRIGDTIVYHPTLEAKLRYTLEKGTIK